METEELTMEEKCENLMNIVVESRKRFGKLCVDYEHKISIMENKLLDLQLETISNCRFKPKQTITNEEQDMSKDIDEFTTEIIERQQRIDNLKTRLRNTQQIVLQLKADNVGRRLKDPITVDVMLAQAKQKKQT
ncbi:uncharacterized protein LOC113510168 [Galleria mellonella]|uniref:Uncharacterized protein LOC113510168 n=1 Tax=Galleria mellonella TaxID=7137 RepID=A0A6J1WGU5_GALME|nr:uncharacterized protein LOC113510168 [Galleria mellonella]